ncbi:MAG: hypothetical protein OEQ28_12710 [Acidobacteriota bacterium]|nr:hypothetical protein [Acidobacteriota bacterium]
MKKIALVVLVFVLVVVGSIAVSAQTAAPQASNTVAGQSAELTLEKARELALKKRVGTVEEEFTLEDEHGKLFCYVFKIRDAKKKLYEVQIAASDGEVLYNELDVVY